MGFEKLHRSLIRLRCQFCFIDNKVGIIVDAEGTRASRIAEIAITRTMLDRVDKRFFAFNHSSLQPILFMVQSFFSSRSSESQE